MQKWQNSTVKNASNIAVPDGYVRKELKMFNRNVYRDVETRVWPVFSFFHITSLGNVPEKVAFDISEKVRKRFGLSSHIRFENNTISIIKNHLKCSNPRLLRSIFSFSFKK